MKLLVLTKDYPNNKDQQKFAYVHTRCKYYTELGLNVVVLSFDSQNAYIFENVHVINLQLFRNNFSIKEFDAVISHAPNLRQHIIFLIRYCRNKPVFFFIHGHEVLNRNKYYPDPYPLLKPNFYFLTKIIYLIYDTIKVYILREFFKKSIYSGSTKIIFVSDWMRKEFLKNIKIDSSLIYRNSIIINNAVANEFILNNYRYDNSVPTKVITIRQFDNPKYAVDLVLKAALDNPEIEFNLFGMGNFFKYHIPPKNLKIISQFLSHSEIPNVLNNYTLAFMPTRLDSQGVMMCEMATYGIPIVTSDLPICREMLSGFSNVFFISNDSTKIQLDNLIKQINISAPINKKKFDVENTIHREIRYFVYILGGKEVVNNEINYQSDF